MNDIAYNSSDIISSFASSPKKTSVAPGMDHMDPSLTKKTQKRFMGQFFKTRMCKYFLSGHCNLGSSCTHAHSHDELVQKPDLTKTRMCPRVGAGEECDDNECQYAHSVSEIRSTKAFHKTKMCEYFMRGHCRLSHRCRYAHDLRELNPAQQLQEDCTGGTSDETPPMETKQTQHQGTSENKSSESQDADYHPGFLAPEHELRRLLTPHEMLLLVKHLNRSPQGQVLLARSSINPLDYGLGPERGPLVKQPQMHMRAPDLPKPSLADPISRRTSADCSNSFLPPNLTQPPMMCSMLNLPMVGMPPMNTQPQPQAPVLSQDPQLVSLLQTMAQGIQGGGHGGYTPQGQSMNMGFFGGLTPMSQGFQAAPVDTSANPTTPARAALNLLNGLTTPNGSLNPGVANSLQTVINGMNNNSNGGPGPSMFQPFGPMTPVGLGRSRSGMSGMGGMEAVLEGDGPEGSDPRDDKSVSPRNEEDESKKKDTSGKPNLQIETDPPQMHLPAVSLGPLGYQTLPFQYKASPHFLSGCSVQPSPAAHQLLPSFLLQTPHPTIQTPQAAMKSFGAVSVLATPAHQSDLGSSRHMTSGGRVLFRREDDTEKGMPTRSRGHSEATKEFLKNEERYTD